MIFLRGLCSEGNCILDQELKRQMVGGFEFFFRRRHLLHSISSHPENQKEEEFEWWGEAPGSGV